MKKLFKSIFCCLLCVLMASGTAFAAEPITPTMNMKWHGDYTNNKIVIYFTTPADYHQQVTIALYPSNVVSPVFSDFVRTAEIYVPSGQGETKVEFPITNSLSALNGEYKLRIQGNGYMASNCSETQIITIITPSKATNILERINAAATADAIDGIINEVKDALQIEVADDPAISEKIMNALINTRTTEYGGAFSTLDIVRDAYIKSDIIVYLAESTANATGLRERVEAQVRFFDIDITDVDYVENASDIYNRVLAVKTTYNTTGIKNCATLIDTIKKYCALIIINESDIDELDEVVAKYVYVLSLPTEILNKYNNFSNANKEKVVRQIYSKGFTVPKDITTAFTTAVNTVYLQLDDSVGSQGSGGLGGESFGMGNSYNSVDVPSTENTNSKTEFKDVAKTHWAYSYISSIYSLNYVSGYADGTFLPDKNVTRDEFVKMIVSATALYDDNAECDFTDVQNKDWSYKFVASANKSGIANGLSDKIFGKGTNITREDVAVIVARIITKFDKEPEGKVNPTLFSDEGEISDYAKDSIHMLERLNILNGFEDNSYQPKGFLTRAQAAKIIALLLEAI